MRKYFSLVLVAVFVMTAGVALAQVTPQVGITQTGVYFMSDSLLQKCNETAPGDPTLHSSLTGGWDRGNPMVKKGGFWIFESNRQIRSRQVFNVQIGFSNYWAAHLLVDIGVLEDNEKDQSVGPGCISVRNGVGGYNFHCTPIAKGPWE